MNITPIITDDLERDLLVGSLELAADTDDLHAAIRRVLSDNPTPADTRRVIRHLRDDDFDFMSSVAHDAARVLTAYLNN